VSDAELEAFSCAGIEDCLKKLQEMGRKKPEAHHQPVELGEDLFGFASKNWCADRQVDLLSSKPLLSTPVLLMH
jgi:hypothetical protein